MKHSETGNNFNLSADEAFNLDESERFALLLATIWYFTEGMTNGADVIAAVAGEIMESFRKETENGGLGATGKDAEQAEG
jgi:hypothetical protein